MFLVNKKGNKKDIWVVFSVSMGAQLLFLLYDNGFWVWRDAEQYEP